MWWWTDAPMPWMVFGPAMMLIFLGVCVALLYLVLRGAGRAARRGDRAMQILKERYARGEIDQAEFEKRRRFLEA